MSTVVDTTAAIEIREKLASRFREESAPRFVESFERASERRLRVLYDEVAPSLSDSFQELATAGEGQLEVLTRVAELVGLEGLDVSKPLPDDASEALAQRVAWRSTARWTVLSLLWALVEWALVESRPYAITPHDWVEVTRTGGGKRPRGRSSLVESDEQLALLGAARSLARSMVLSNGAGLLLLGVPVVIRAGDDANVTAEVVRPIALVETSSDCSRLPVGLTAGDRVWPVDVATEGFLLYAEHEGTGTGVLTITGEGCLSVPDGKAQAVRVVRGITLLFKGYPLEDIR